MHRNIFDYILCVVFGHIFLLDIFSVLYLVIFSFLRAISLYTYLFDIIKLATKNKATRLFLNTKVQGPDLIEGDIDLWTWSLQLSPKNTPVAIFGTTQSDHEARVAIQIFGTVHCEQKSLTTESAVQCKAASRQCNVRLHFALLCSATLTLASVVTRFLEEYIQWKDPSGRFITSPEFISGKGAGCAIYVLEPSLSFPFTYVALVTNMKGAQSAVFQRGDLFHRLKWNQLLQTFIQYS